MPTGIVVSKPSCEWKHCNLLLKTALASCLQYGLQLGYVWAGKNSENQPQQACQKPDVAELLLQAKSTLTWWSVMLCVWSRGGVVAYAAVLARNPCDQKQDHAQACGGFTVAFDIQPLKSLYTTFSIRLNQPRCPQVLRVLRQLCWSLHRHSYHPPRPSRH